MVITSSVETTSKRKPTGSRLIGAPVDSDCSQLKLWTLNAREPFRIIERPVTGRSVFFVFLVFDPLFLGLFLISSEIFTSAGHDDDETSIYYLVSFCFLVSS